jgi:uncharacterized protein (DUF2252 family)
MNIEAAYALSDARAGPLAQTRNLKMARSSHAYVRGNTIKFYEWLAHFIHEGSFLRLASVA